MYRHGTLGWNTNENMMVGIVLIAPSRDHGQSIASHLPQLMLNNRMGKYRVKYTLHIKPNMDVNQRWSQSRGSDNGSRAKATYKIAHTASFQK